MTFRNPAVLEALAEFELVKIDIDVQGTRDLCGRYHGGDDVPAFVVADADGSERLRWIGALPPEALIEKLQLAREGDTPELDAESALIDECATARYTAKWRLLEQASRKFAATFPESPRRREVELLGEIAAFELSGELSSILAQRIDTLIETLREPYPGDAIGPIRRRLRRLLGQPRPADLVAACDVWVDRQNDSMRALTDIGRPARGRLIKALLTEAGDVGRSAATALAWMRLIDTPAMLLDRITDESLSAQARSRVVACVGAHQDARTLAPLIARLVDVRENAAVRSKAARAIGKIVGVSGAARTDIAKALESGLRSNDASLREQCLQALLEIRAPVDLELLHELLSDRRPLYLHYKMRDNVLWVLLEQLDKTIVDAGGKDVGDRCTPEVAAFMRGWYASMRERLQWDVDRECYVTR